MLTVPFVCPDCGEVDHWLFDASIVNDRAFEGIFFKLTIVEDQIVVTTFAKDAEYLSDFKMKKIPRLTHESK